MRTQYYPNFRRFLGDSGPDGHGHGRGWAVIGDDGEYVGFVREESVSEQHLDAAGDLPAYVAEEMMTPIDELD